ncbi:MAG: glutamine synthetase family protein [Balneolaceae bacterium]
MNKEEIIQLIQELGVKNIKFAVTDIDGVLRGKLISTEKFLNALDDQIGFCNVIFGWDMNDAVYDNTKVSGWHTGYPDSFATIDPGSYRKIPWDNNKPFFLADFSQVEDMKLICPRSLLKKVRKEALDLDLIPKFSAEFEWFNFDETMHSIKEKDYTNPTPLTTGMFGYSVLRASQNSDYINELFDLLHGFGIPLEGLHTETGDGVYEAAIAYDEILESADRATLFKTSVKEIASQFDLIASFMAKWNPDLPGCSQHIHQSLVNKSGKNLFFDASKEGKMSDLFNHYLAGQLACLPHILPMFAPTVNSYKRFVEGSWAATSVSWGIENRTVALRVINQKKHSMRLENRVPGADANPYLTMAASLASGLYGIKHKLKLETPPTVGNEYDSKTSKALPENLHKATMAMKESNIPKELFGDDFVDHFIKTREWEWRQYKPNQKNWELKRYFEII